MRHRAEALVLRMLAMAAVTPSPLAQPASPGTSRTSAGSSAGSTAGSTAGPVAQGTVWENAAFGVRLRLPAGWTAEEQGAGGSSLHVTFVPPEPGTPARAALRVDPSVPPDAERMRQLSLAAVVADDDYDDARTVVRTVGRRALLGLEVDADVQGVDFALRQAYVVEHGLPFLLQDYADRSIAERWAPVFDELWDGLEFPPRPDEAEARARLLALAARCGSELPWADGWEAAAARARGEGKPVLVTVFLYPGYAAADARMSGAFMDEDVLALVSTRTVPMRYERGTSAPFAAADVHGLGPHTFGEAVLLASPDGEVLAESRVMSERWLREALRTMPQLPGDPVPDTAHGLARARELCARGELDAALPLLAGASTPAACLLRARIHRREQRGEQALADLDRAAELAGDGPESAGIAVERALVLIGLRRTAEGDALLERAHLRLAADGDARAAEALLLRAELAEAEGRRAQAEWLHRRVLDQHPDTRWAWRAAAALTSTAWELGLGADPGWPAPEEWREFEPPVFASLTAAFAERGRTDALAWLLAGQQDDGSWLVPAEVGRAPDAPRHDFELAVSSLCLSALLPHRGEPGVDAAVARAEAWLRAAIDEAEDEVAFMDYAVWSRAYMLACVADLVRAADGPEAREALEARDGGEGGRDARRDAWDGRARRLVDELARREKPGGGWSYHVTRDLRLPGDTSAQAMSFTTAAVVLALLSARDAGFDVPRDLVERGLDTVQRAREGRRSYAYMVYPSGTGAQDPLAVAGDAGRGPVCALALYRGGRGSLEDIEDALALFDSHRATYARELGKALLHTGPEGQGSHYLMFDHAYAALAAAELPPPARQRFRGPVLEEVLRAHTAEGAYVDTTVNGRSYGAAMALLALDALR